MGESSKINIDLRIIQKSLKYKLQLFLSYKLLLLSVLILALGCSKQEKDKVEVIKIEGLQNLISEPNHQLQDHEIDNEDKFPENLKKH